MSHTWCWILLRGIGIGIMLFKATKKLVNETTTILMLQNPPQMFWVLVHPLGNLTKLACLKSVVFLVIFPSRSSEDLEFFAPPHHFSLSLLLLANSTKLDCHQWRIAWMRRCFYLVDDMFPLLPSNVNGSSVELSPNLT